MIELSVITPVLNAIDHIGPCIDNVIAQDVLEIERLIVDGGSTDGTVEFVRQAAERHPHIRLIEGTDRGRSHAMNKGVAFANASILGTLNVDDRYYPGAVALKIAISHLRNATEPADERQVTALSNRLSAPSPFGRRGALIGGSRGPYLFEMALGPLQLLTRLPLRQQQVEAEN
ncbi:MAG TPA: glycosyltransferase [Ilumatobacter sp.]|nr:glycosyltransferase [Ilumatobacter sp.]